MPAGYTKALEEALAQRAIMNGEAPIAPPPDNAGKKGLRFLTSALGLTPQEKHDLPTGLGSLLGAAVPLAGKMRGLFDVAEGAEEISPLLKEIFAKNPAAEGIYRQAMEAQAPAFMEAHRAGQSAKYAQLANEHDALLNAAYGDHPTPIPTPNGFATAIPKQSTVTPAIPPQGPKVPTRLTAAMANNLAGMTAEEARATFPTISPTMLSALVGSK